jgi:hypothetical protein
MGAAIRAEGYCMELLTVGSILVCALVGSLVGIKLLTIAARSHKFPELAIGIALFSYAALSQPALLVKEILGEEVSPGLQIGVTIFNLLFLYVTLVALALFTWRVFGAESRWRPALAAGIAVGALTGAGVSVWHTWLQLSANLPTIMYRSLGMTPFYVLGFGWMSVESLRYHARMRKRLALGLADPVLTNRFLVWGTGQAVSTLVTLVLFVAIMTQPEISPSDPLVAWVVTLAGLVNAVVWWLTFMPPAAYLRWVGGSAAEGASNG